jgi:hypothetical protein
MLGKQTLRKNAKGGIDNNDSESVVGPVYLPCHFDNGLPGQVAQSTNHVLQDLHSDSNRYYPGLGKWRQLWLGQNAWLGPAICYGRYPVSGNLTHDSFPTEVPQVVV